MFRDRPFAFFFYQGPLVRGAKKKNKKQKKKKKKGLVRFETEIGECEKRVPAQGMGLILSRG
jgi:hypothetical protein